MISFILFIYLLSVTINLFFWMGWKIVPVGNKTFSHNVTTPDENGVSIIICAKNELTALQMNLSSILNQNYSLFEVIVVDDGSSDGSLAWLYELAEQNVYLRVLSCKNTLPGKKQALKFGVDCAKYKWILLTDADCSAVSSFWIEEMMNARLQNSKIVLGYSPYKKCSGWLNKIIRFETTMTAIQYFSAVSYGYSYMGVGRNILYHKTAFSNYDRIIQFDKPSGDDDLLVNSFANRNNVTSCLTPKSHVISEPESSWKLFVLQKTRHVSTSYSYKLNHKIVLILFAASQVGTLLVFFLLFSFNWRLVLIIYLFRLIIILFRSKPLFKQLNVNDLWISIPILDVGISLYYLLIHPLGLIYNWGNNSKFVHS